MKFNIISKHLPKQNLALKIHEGINEICSFTGEKIDRGVRNKDLIKKTFSDKQYIRYKSEYTSVDVALLIEEVFLKEKEGKLIRNALRSFSFLATEKELIFLDKSKFIANHLFNLPNEPFFLCITYSHKKHIAYKASLNYSNTEFIVTTDEGDVLVNLVKAKEILLCISKWYTVTPETQGKSQEATYFTKDEIRFANPPTHKIVRYGINLYKQENEQIQAFRNTAIFNFLVNLLQKSYASN